MCWCGSTRCRCGRFFTVGNPSPRGRPIGFSTAQATPSGMRTTLTVMPAMRNTRSAFFTTSNGIPARPDWCVNRTIGVGAVRASGMRMASWRFHSLAGQPSRVNRGPRPFWPQRPRLHQQPRNNQNSPALRNRCGLQARGPETRHPRKMPGGTPVTDGPLHHPGVREQVSAARTQSDRGHSGRSGFAYTNSPGTIRTHPHIGTAAGCKPAVQSQSTRIASNLR